MRKKNLFPIRIENEHIFTSDMQFSFSRRTLIKPYPVHCHEFYELEYIISGEGTHNLNGTELWVQSGSFYLLTPADFHSISPISDKIENFNMMFSRAWLEEEIIKALYTCSRPFNGLLSYEDAVGMRVVLERLEYEYKKNDGYRLTVIQNLVSIIMCDVLRNLAKTKEDNMTYGSEIQKAMWYLESCFRTKVSLKDIAEHVHLSTSYFSQLFKKSVGMTFSEYLQNLRLEYANNLLRSSDMPIGEVCYQSGFGSTEHFVRTYKKRYSYTPGEARASEKSVK